MRRMIFSLVTAAALLASVGAVNANPVKLTDVQLDNATAGVDAAVSAAAASELSTLMAITRWTLGWLNGVPQPLPGFTGLTATP